MLLLTIEIFFFYFTSVLNYIRIDLWALFPLITFAVYMIYLQIIYQHEALQMPEMIKQKHFNWP